MPETRTAQSEVDTYLQDVIGDLDVTTLECTVVGDGLHEEEIDFRLTENGRISAGLCSCCVYCCRVVGVPQEENAAPE